MTAPEAAQANRTPVAFPHSDQWPIWEEFGEESSDPSWTADERQFIEDPMELQVIKEPMFRPSMAPDDLDMRLIWFYTSSTASSFSSECGPDRPVENLLKTRIVRHAFETPFLMHSLLALSALHLQTLKQPIDPRRAIAYRVRAVEGYRQAIERADPKTFPAMICNSLFLVSLSSHNFRDPDGKDLYIIDWMVVWRGIGLMIQLIGVERIVQSGLHSIFYRPPINMEAATRAIPDNLLAMVASIPSNDIDHGEPQTVYYTTLQYLGSLYFYLRRGFNPSMTLRIVSWLTFLQSEFIQLARQKRPRALVILAHYSVFLKASQFMWWLRGIGQRTLSDIIKHLGDEWAPYLEIPRKALKIDDHMDICRLLLNDPNWTSPIWSEEENKELLAAVREMGWVNHAGKRVPMGHLTQDPNVWLVDGPISPSDGSTASVDAASQKHTDEPSGDDMPSTWSTSS